MSRVPSEPPATPGEVGPDSPDIRWCFELRVGVLVGPGGAVIGLPTRLIQEPGAFPVAAVMACLAAGDNAIRELRDELLRMSESLDPVGAEEARRCYAAAEEVARATAPRTADLRVRLDNGVLILESPE